MKPSRVAIFIVISVVGYFVLGLVAWSMWLGYLREDWNALLWCCVLVPLNISVIVWTSENNDHEE